MIIPKSYKAKLPIELYAKLLEVYPFVLGESEGTWLRRVKPDPMLARKMFGTPEFRTELIQAVARRTMAQAGATRVRAQAPGPSLIQLSKPGANATIAPRYGQEFMVTTGLESHYRYAKEAYALLLEQFDGMTPANGGIFWNGINELALAQLVDTWNQELKGEMFGQLEATTTAVYVNKQFKWQTGGVFAKYFTEVSDKLGHSARGHVTAVVRCGLRFDSILTHTELPRMLKGIEADLAKKQSPGITDLTIVVIEPKHLPNRPVMAFTNAEITMIPIVRQIGQWINRREDCTIDQNFSVGIRVREYFSGRKTGLSPAAKRIMADYEKLVRW